MNFRQKNLFYQKWEKSVFKNRSEDFLESGLVSGLQWTVSGPFSGLVHVFKVRLDLVEKAIKQKRKLDVKKTQWMLSKYWWSQKTVHLSLTIHFEPLGNQAMDGLKVYGHYSDLKIDGHSKDLKIDGHLASSIPGNIWGSKWKLRPSTCPVFSIWDLSEFRPRTVLKVNGPLKDLKTDRYLASMTPVKTWSSKSDRPVFPERPLWTSRNWVRFSQILKLNFVSSNFKNRIIWIKIII